MEMSIFNWKVVMMLRVERGRKEEMIRVGSKGCRGATRKSTNPWWCGVNIHMDQT